MLNDVVFFSRSGFAKSPGITRLFWLGDQTTSWDKNDGLKSAVVGLLAGGLSGQAINHSDIGGYAAVALSKEIGLTRSKELFQRWTEMAAFTPVFRTHEGNQPQNNHQFDTDKETLEHFVKFAKIYREFAQYRRDLMKEAKEKGWPMVRPMAFYHMEDPVARNLDGQFYLGSEFIVAPVLDKGASSVRAWLPAGHWIHLWSGQEYVQTQGTSVTVPAPIGQPAVFYKKDSQTAESIRKRISFIR
jgi:alpha-glucosidase